MFDKIKLLLSFYYLKKSGLIPEYGHRKHLVWVLKWFEDGPFKPLSAIPTKWSNTLRHSSVNRLSEFDHFVGLVLKELAAFKRSKNFRDIFRTL